MPKFPDRRNQALKNDFLNGVFAGIPEALPEQSKIAEVLSTVDRVVEQTEGLIAKQQRIKTGLMQDLLTRGIDEHGQPAFRRNPHVQRFPPGPDSDGMGVLGFVTLCSIGRIWHLHFAW